MIELVYARDVDGNIVHIDDVPRGEICGCRCLDEFCGSVLIAKKGAIKGHHFAHKTPTDKCQVSGGGESALHYLAKTIVKEEGKVLTPSYGGDILGSRVSGLSHAECEVRFGGKFSADVSGFDDSGSVMDIEIYVTNPCSDDKVEYLRLKKRNSLSIDLSKVPRDLSVEDVKTLVLYSADRKWIYLDNVDDESEVEEDGVFESNNIEVMVQKVYKSKKYCSVTIYQDIMIRNLFPHEAREYVMEGSKGIYCRENGSFSGQGFGSHELNISSELFSKLVVEAGSMPFKAKLTFKLQNASGKTEFIVLDINKVV